MRLFALIALAVLLAACGSNVVEYPRSQRTAWDARWRDAEGSALHEDVVSTGYAECVDAVLLYLGWPLGTAFKTADSAHTYVRDPDGTLATAGPLDLNATLPESARNTGYHLAGLQLWLGRDASKAAYLVEGTKVERWPRLIELVGCV